MRCIFQRAAIERDQALIAVHVRALVDGHREMTLTKQRGAIRLARRDHRCHAILIEARAGAHFAGRREVHDQHPHRTVALRLQNEAAVNLQGRTEHDCQAPRPHPGAWRPVADRRGAQGSRPPRGQAAQRDRAGRVWPLRTASRCHRRSWPMAREKEWRFEDPSWALCSVQRPECEPRGSHHPHDGHSR